MEKPEIEIQIDPSRRRPKVTILTAALTDDIQGFIRLLEGGTQHPEILAGYREGQGELLEPRAIVRVYAENQRVMAQTEKAVYRLRMRLYEAEEALRVKGFVRISHAELVNLKMILRMDMSLGGTIGVELQGGTRTFVSRRYVSKIKQLLGI